MDKISDNRRIARNTLMLYIRMGITMLISLYTSRIILEVLGIDDYGIWSLVASLVISISFITAPLSNATQRFISYEIGRDDELKASVVFSQCVFLYIAFGLFILIILETFGLWFLNNKLNIPNDKIYVTNVVYQISIISFIITLLRIPYDATIIAYEKMTFYAYMSIIDVIFKLGIVFLLDCFNGVSNLILYGIFSLVVTLIITLVYKVYCNKYYSISKIIFRVNKKVLIQILSFSGWSLMGAFSVASANQGVGMILNMFYGVAINATIGITNQVSNAINQFVTNLQIAFSPPIVKAYSVTDEPKFINLIVYCAQISFLLMLIIITPIIFNIEFVLQAWLGTLPEYLCIFCQLTLIYMLIDTLSSALNIGIYASGRIKVYQILISLSIFLLLPLSYILLKNNIPPQSVLWCRIVISIITLLIRVFYLNYHINGLVLKKIIRVILRMAIVVLLCWGGIYLILRMTTIVLWLSVLLEILWTGFIIWNIGLQKPEKKLIINTIHKIDERN